MNAFKNRLTLLFIVECVILCFLNIIQIVYVTAAAQGATEPKVIRAHVGESVSLPCHVDRKQCGNLHSVKWYKDMSRIYVLSHAGSITRAEGDAMNRLNVTYDSSDVEALLKISPVKVDDEATYKCEITYLEVRESCDVVQILKLKTLIKPESVKITNSTNHELANNTVLGPKEEGEEIDLICEAAHGKPLPKVRWFNGTSEITRAEYTSTTNSNNESTAMGIGTGRSKLQLTLSRGDLNAKFECRVESEALEHPIISTISVDVHVRPTKIELTGVENHVVQGTNVLLMCDVYGARPAATVRWTNGSTRITDLPQTSSEDNRDGTYTTKSQLVFKASHYENGIKIHCYAENNVTRNHHEPEMHVVFILEVRYPPVISVRPKNITVNETTALTANGNGTLLICSYKANPQELKAAFWSKDDVNLTVSDGNKYIGGTIEYPPLIIYNVTREDMGEYVCWLKNEIGLEHSEDSIFVNVQYQPDVEVVMKPSMPVKAIDKGEVLLECNVTSGNPSSLLKVRWFLDNELMKEFPECNYTSQDSDTAGDGGPFCGLDPTILSLERVDETFAGNYTCQGENVAGWGPVSEPQELIIYYPPSPAKLRYYPSKVIKEGSVVLDCRVDSPGRPDNITYIWYRGSHQMSEFAASFNITPVRLETRSNFTCIAQNEGGQSEPATAFINVNAPPAFIQKLPTYQGFLYSSKHINITCRVECFPMCDIIWKKDGHTLNLTNNPRYYNITKIYPPDLQKYDFESIESTLVFNMTSWPQQQLDINAPNSVYTCESTSNAVGNGVRSSIEIAVDFPPQDITITPSVVTVIENEAPKSVIKCSGRGHPKLHFEWKRNNVVYEGEELRLKKLNRSDAGSYSCNATNKHGTKIKTLHINIHYPPKCSLTRTERDGSPALLCTVEVNPPPVNFTWKVVEGNETFIATSDIFQDGLKSFLILDSTVDIPRTYYCIPSNIVGPTKDPCHINVKEILPWWKRLDNEKLIIIIASVIAIIICVIIICLVFIILCRRKRANIKCKLFSAFGTITNNIPIIVSYNRYTTF